MHAKALFLFLFLIHSPVFACKVSFGPQMALADGVLYTAEFETIDGDAPSSMALDAFRANARARIDVNPYQVLLHQRTLWARAFPAAPAVLAKFDQFLNREVGKIRAINCIEQSLFMLHLEIFGAETEFGALIFQKEGESKTLALVKSERMAAVNLREYVPQIEELLKNGWQLFSMLHNHPFLFNNPLGDYSGVTMPGDPDVISFREYKERFRLQNAWITNGFDSIELKSEEFERILLTQK